MQSICCIQYSKSEGGPDTYLPGRDHSWRAGKRASQHRGGGYSLTAKQEVAQHLLLGIQRGSEQPAVCFRVRLHAKNATFRQTMSHSSLFSKSLKSERNCIALLKISIFFKRSSHKQWRKINVGLIPARDLVSELYF